MRTTIYVANLPENPNADALRAHFGSCGLVSDVKIVPDRAVGRGRGTASVEMCNEAGTRRALAELNGSMFQGQLLLLEAGPSHATKRVAKRDADESGQDSRARITMQFRELTHMTYELDCGTAVLILRIYFPPSAGEWRVLAQASRGDGAPTLSSTATSRVEALRSIARSCAESPHAGAFAHVDWTAVELSMTKVRAL